MTALRVALLVGLVLLVGAPLVGLAGALAADPSQILAVLRDAPNREAALNTVVVALGATGVAVAAGLPLGVVFGRVALPGRALWLALATAPYVVPPHVQAIGWIALTNPTTGWLNRPLLALGLPALDPYGLTGMIAILGIEHAPIVLLAVAGALAGADASLEEQARVSGASPWLVARRVTIPLVLPAVRGAAGLVIAASAAAFGVPYLLASGSASPRYVLTTRIAQALELDPARGRPLALGLSLALLLLGVGLPLVLTRAGPRAATVGGKAARPAPLALGPLRPVVLGFVAGWGLVAVAMPLAALFVLSVLPHAGATTLTADHYAAVLGRGSVRDALLRSLALAAGAATLATAIGGLTGWLRARDPGPVAGFAAGLARFGAALPGTVLALGLLLAWSQELRVIVAESVTFRLLLTDGPWLLLLAYTARFLALPTAQAEAGAAAIDPSLEEAARVSGASLFVTLRRIVLPLLGPTLLAGWLLVFLPAFSEVTMSVLLAGPSTRVVGPVLFDLLTYGDPGQAAALAGITTLVVLGGDQAARRLSRAA